MGGTLNRFRDDWETTWLVLSQRSTNAGGETQIVRDLNEMYSAAAVLGVTDIRTFDIPSQNFSQFEETVFDIIQRDTSEFDLVFAPSPRDRHQDHPIVAAHALRIFADRLLYFPVPASASSAFTPDLFVKLAEADAVAKVQSCAEYRSQYERDESRGYYFGEEYVRAYLHRYQDMYAGYLEGFEVASLVG